MALNPNKSEAILLGTRQRAHSYSNLATVNVAGSQIPLTDHVKILGVKLDKNLSMNNHVNAVCKSVHYHIRALRHIRSSISKDMAKMIASVLVDYAKKLCSVWNHSEKHLQTSKSTEPHGPCRYQSSSILQSTYSPPAALLAPD